MNETTIYHNALLSIATMDCLTREGEKPAHILMQEIAKEAINTVIKSKQEENINQLNIQWEKQNPERKENGTS